MKELISRDFRRFRSIVTVFHFPPRCFLLFPLPRRLFLLHYLLISLILSDSMFFNTLEFSPTLYLPRQSLNDYVMWPSTKRNPGGRGQTVVWYEYPHQLYVHAHVMLCTKFIRKADHHGVVPDSDNLVWIASFGLFFTRQWSPTWTDPPLKYR